MTLIQSPAGTIEVVDWEDGDVFFVLLHASATGPRSLAGLAHRLSRADRCIVAPASVGYGQTELGDAEVGDRATPIDRSCMKFCNVGRPVDAFCSGIRWAV
jgi:hypothetical protein